MPKLSKADQDAKVSANEARRRKEVALAELREMERDERRAVLIPADQVKDAWTKVLMAVKAAVLRIPDKLAPAVAAVADPRECRGILAGECEAILGNLSNDVHRITEPGNRRRGGRAETPAAAISRGVGKRELPAE